MPAIHVRDVPADVVTALKARAARAGHSLQKELIAVLTQVASQPLPPTDVTPLTLQTTRTGGRQRFDREHIYHDGG